MADSKEGGFVNGEFYGFARAGFSMAGNKLVAVSSVNYDDSIELEEVDGANMAPIGFGEGKYRANFKLSVKKEDFDNVVMPQLTGENTPVYEHDPFDFAVSYAKRKADKIMTDTIKGVRITNITHTSQDGDKSTMVEITGKALGGIWRNGKKPVSTGA